MKQAPLKIMEHRKSPPCIQVRMPFFQVESTITRDTLNEEAVDQHVSLLFIDKHAVMYFDDVACRVKRAQALRLSEGK